MPACNNQSLTAAQR